MNADLDQELPLRPYLLGDLNSDEQQRLEQRLMIDSAAFEELNWIEDELIDDYLEDALAAQERQKFESWFLAAPERRQKLDFAKALKRYVTKHRPKPNALSVLRNSWQAIGGFRKPVMSWFIAASLLLLIAGGMWSGMQISSLQKQLAKARSFELEKRLAEIQNRNSELTSTLQREQARLRQLEQQAGNLKYGDKDSSSSLLSGQIHSTLYSITLAPGLLRDFGGSQKVSIPAGTELVQFDLKMEPQDYPRYRATLHPVGEAETWQQISPVSGPAKKGQVFQMTIRANVLFPGDYVLKLSGMTAVGDFEDIGNYYFRVAGR